MGGIAGLVFAVSGLLGLIAFLPPLASRLRIPYTVLLASLGIVLGIVIGAWHGLVGAGLESVPADFIAQLRALPINAQLFLWVFLPLLLFETSIHLDGQALLDDLAPVLVMAVLAVIVTTALGGLAVWGALGLPEPGLIACFLVAAIVATTDPSAVVAIFREVGAPRRLTSLVEGESLLNDAAAIALFSALLGLLLYPDTSSVSSLPMGFLWAFGGGTLLGLVAGRLGAGLVSRLDQGGPAEVTLSVALAYATYGFAEIYLQVSGVVAVVIAGLVFGTVGRSRAGTNAWRAISTIWQQIGFWASSLIFVLASMLVPRTLTAATLGDILGLTALLAGALLARALTLFLVMPAISRLQRQRPIDNRYKLVILWGGLRGAVTLALALAVTQNPRLDPAVQHLVSVLATGFVLFTLLVQATTLRPLLRRLRLDQLDPLERMLRARALEIGRAEIRDRISAAAITHGIDLENSAKIRSLLEPVAEAEAAIEPSEESQREQLVAALATLSNRESELYADELGRRLIGRTTGALLVRQAAALTDALKIDGVQGYRRQARRQAGFDPLTRLAAWIYRRLGIQTPLAASLAMRIEKLIVRRHVLEELLSFNRRRIRAVYGERVADTSGLVLEQRLGEVDRSLDALRLQYPRHWQAVSARYIARIVTRLEADGFARMVEEHLLSPQLHRHLLTELRARRRAMERIPRLDLGLGVHTLVAKMPLFAGLDEEDRKDVAKLLRPMLVLPGERIVRRGEAGDSMYFIASGAVEVMLGEERVRLGSGDFFGEAGLLMGQPRNADVVALGYCQLLVLAQDALGTFLREHPELVGEVRRVARERLPEALLEGSAG
ncbi:cation:proton antiporter [Geminicoccaceae bacterium 1502E]|nr:cation:proton antiporter [Geminicoccaceae bacterium 1502E]